MLRKFFYVQKTENIATFFMYGKRKILQLPLCPCVLTVWSFDTVRYVNDPWPQVAGRAWSVSSFGRIKKIKQSNIKLISFFPAVFARV